MYFEQITYSFTPNMLMLGPETNQPADLMFGEGQEDLFRQ
jgi:hypothetical protein